MQLYNILYIAPRDDQDAHTVEATLEHDLGRTPQIILWQKYLAAGDHYTHDVRYISIDGYS